MFMPSSVLNDACKKAEISCHLLEAPRYLDQPVMYCDTAERSKVFTEGKKSFTITPAEKLHNSLIKVRECYLKGANIAYSLHKERCVLYRYAYPHLYGLSSFTRS